VVRGTGCVSIDAELAAPLDPTCFFPASVAGAKCGVLRGPVRNGMESSMLLFRQEFKVLNPVVFFVFIFVVRVVPRWNRPIVRYPHGLM